MTEPIAVIGMTPLPVTTTPHPKQDNPYTRQYENFLRNTEGHVLTVELDLGLNRILRMHNPNFGSTWSWRIVTGPGFLSTMGDIADGFTFSRIEDMIDFFDCSDSQNYYSDGAPCIDFRYWAEKLRGNHSRDTTIKYDQDHFLARLREHLDESEEFGIEAREERKKTIAMVKKIHQVRGLTEAESDNLIQAYISTKADAVTKALRAMWSTEGLSDEQINDLIENHNYHEYGDVEFTPQPIEDAIAEIMQDARWESDNEEQAHGWLSDNEEKIGAYDTWEWNLRDYDVHFLFTCWAIEKTVRAWREYTALHSDDRDVWVHFTAEETQALGELNAQLDVADVAAQSALDKITQSRPDILQTL